MSNDQTCILRRPPSILLGRAAETVICGQAIVEGYLRLGYTFDWKATDAARVLATTAPAPAMPVGGDRACECCGK